MLLLDGSAGEGGGQILRTALALSLSTGAPFRIDGIRAGRRRPGLMRQHLTAVRAAAEIGGAAYLFAGPSEAGKSTIALRLAARGCRHLSDDRILLLTGAAPWRVAGLGLAAKARQPLAPGPELAALVAARWYLTDDSIAYLHLSDDEALGFGDTRPLGAVILPRRDAGLTFDARLEPAGAGEIARALIEEATAPAGPATLVPAMTRLAEGCPGFILSYRDGAAAADLLLSELTDKGDG